MYSLHWLGFVILKFPLSLSNRLAAKLYRINKLFTPAFVVRYSAFKVSFIPTCRTAHTAATTKYRRKRKLPVFIKRAKYKAINLPAVNRYEDGDSMHDCCSRQKKLKSASQIGKPHYRQTLTPLHWLNEKYLSIIQNVPIKHVIKLLSWYSILAPIIGCLSYKSNAATLEPLKHYPLSPYYRFDMRRRPAATEDLFSHRSYDTYASLLYYFFQISSRAAPARAHPHSMISKTSCLNSINADQAPCCYQLSASTTHAARWPWPLVHISETSAIDNDNRPSCTVRRTSWNALTDSWLDKAQKYCSNYDQLLL